ncbi:MAG: hypothetical protein E7616_09545 [Ruminococcaceae bacterium]|nr:hypothetical protein [Oscillospiraceae bacterium]
MENKNNEKQPLSVGRRKRSPRFLKSKEVESNPHKDIAALKLLVTVVNRNKAEFYIDFLHQYEVNMQCTMMGMGTALSKKARYLGLPDKEKAVIFSYIREDRSKEILSALEDKFASVRNGKGVAYTIPFSGIIGVASYQFLADNRMTKED